MNDLHPILRRAFALSRPESSAPSADLEERVLAGWRQMPLPFRDPATRVFRFAFALAALLLFLTCTVSFRILTETPDPSLVLANIAIRGSLTHD